MEDLAADEVIEESWSVGLHKHNIDPGDVAYFLKQGTGERGIVGRVEVLSTPWQAPRWDDPSRTCNYVDIAWLEAVPETDLLPVALLRNVVPEVPWNNIQQSGLTVDPEAEVKLAVLWVANTEVDRDIDEPDSSDVVTFVEGSPALLMATRYERVPAARRACLNHWGYVCAACDRSMEDMYGDLGKNYIHVHHLNPLGEVGKQHVVDPVADMRPLCPNCHTMAHRRQPVIGLAELRKRIKAANKRERR